MIVSKADKEKTISLLQQLTDPILKWNSILQLDALQNNLITKIADEYKFAEWKIRYYLAKRICQQLNDSNINLLLKCYQEENKDILTLIQPYFYNFCIKKPITAIQLLENHQFHLRSLAYKTLISICKRKPTLIRQEIPLQNWVIANQLLNILWKATPNNPSNILVGFENNHTIKATLLICLETNNMLALPYILKYYTQKSYQKLIDKNCNKLNPYQTKTAITSLFLECSDPQLKENIYQFIHHHPEFKINKNELTSLKSNL